MTSPSASTATESAMVQPPTDATQSGSAKRDPRFYIAIGVAILWLILLACLSLLTANPVTVNRVQILSSEAVVEAEILDQNGEFKVEKIIIAHQAAPLEVGQTIKLSPAPARWTPGMKRLIPLTQRSPEKKDDANIGPGPWWITPAPLPKTVQLDYPSTSEVLLQIEQIVQAPAE